MTTKTVDQIIADNAANYERPDVVEFLPEPDPEPLFCPIISVDDHVLEPATLFKDRLPSKHSEKVPHVIEDAAGSPWWQIDDARVPIIVCDGSSGRPMSQWGFTPSRAEDFRPGVSDPRARLGDMDIVGVWASLGFASTVWGFAGTRFSLMVDADLGLACLRAYNDWMLEEWCATDRDRYIPCQLPWLADPEVGAAEIRRNSERGFRAVSFSENPETLGFPHIYGGYWDPFLRACEETETVVNLHVGSSGARHLPSSASPGDVGTVLFPVHGLTALADWIYAKVPVRFPDIKIVLSEAGVSWLPMVLERFHRAFRQAGSPHQTWSLADPDPADLVRRNFYFTSIEDPSAFRLLDIIGEDRVMVETDYPHFDSTWPHSQAMVRSQMDTLSPETIRQVCYGNAARVYRHPEPPKSWIDRSEVSVDGAIPA